MATLNLGRVRGEKGADSTVPGPRGIPGPPGPQGPKGEDATNANLGTAATRDVGGSAGNVMEVGAFGLGGQCAELPVGTDIKTHPFVTGFYMGVGLLNSPTHSDVGNDWFYYEVMKHNDMYIVIIAHGFFYTNHGSYKLRKEAGVWGEWEGIANNPLHYNQTTSKLPNLVVSETGKIKRSSAVDPTGNLAVPSIQAGAGAPKIAHKKITGTTSSAISSSVTLQTGIAADKIIGMSCLVASRKGLIPPNTYPNGGDELYYCVFNPDGSIKVSLSSGSASYGVVSKPITILLTYEV